MITTVKIHIAVLFASLILYSISGYAASTNQADTQPNPAEYVSVDLSTVPTADGKTLVISAYSVVFSLLLFYVVSLIQRENIVRRKTERLQKELKK